MKTDFSFKLIKIATLIFSFVFIFCSVIYSYILKETIIVYNQKEFYFLVSDEDNEYVSSQDIYINGGAGYIYKGKKRNYAVIASYNSEDVAKKIQEELKKKNIKTKVILKKSSPLYLKKRNEKKHKNIFVGCFETLGNCIDILYHTANKLDRGEIAQEQTKDCLEMVKNILLFIYSDNNENVLNAICSAAYTAAKQLGEMLSNVVYSRDIRYTQIYLIDEYLRRSFDFSL